MLCIQYYMAPTNKHSFSNFVDSFIFLRNIFSIIKTDFIDLYPSLLISAFLGPFPQRSLPGIRVGKAFLISQNIICRIYLAAQCSTKRKYIVKPLRLDN